MDESALSELLIVLDQDGYSSRMQAYRRWLARWVEKVHVSTWMDPYLIPPEQVAAIQGHMYDCALRKLGQEIAFHPGIVATKKIQERHLLAETTYCSVTLLRHKPKEDVAMQSTTNPQTTPTGQVACYCGKTTVPIGGCCIANGVTHTETSCDPTTWTIPSSQGPATPPSNPAPTSTQPKHAGISSLPLKPKKPPPLGMSDWTSDWDLLPDADE